MNTKDIFSLDGKFSIVTGASRGNGKAIAEALAKAGSTVLLVDILEDELQTTTNLFKNNKLNVMSLHIDISKPNAPKKIVEAALKNMEHIDVLVNNAGITLGAPLQEYTDEMWEKTIAINLTAPFRLVREIAPIMKKKGSGSIINITSLNSEMAFPDNPAYIASKGGLKMLSKSLALDLGKDGIRVNNIGPGYIHTEMTKGSFSDPEKHKARASHTTLGRWGFPEDLGGIAVFLASDASNYITGQDIYVDGGWLCKGL